MKFGPTEVRLLSPEVKTRVKDRIRPRESKFGLTARVSLRVLSAISRMSIDSQSADIDIGSNVIVQTSVAPTAHPPDTLPGMSVVTNGGVEASLKTIVPATAVDGWRSDRSDRASAGNTLTRVDEVFSIYMPSF
jgi:hypothetical protein